MPILVPRVKMSTQGDTKCTALVGSFMVFVHMQSVSIQYQGNKRKLYALTLCDQFRPVLGLKLCIN